MAVPGSHTIQARAYDAAGNTTTSSVTVSVVTPPSDTTAPTVSITSPASGATVSGSVALAATASDNVGVTRVEFYADGTLVGTDASSPYAGTWNATSATPGSHTIQARAYDAAGNTTTSSVTVSVTVPSVSFTDSFGTDDLAANWTQQSGTWGITGGKLQITTSDSTHHLCYAKNLWLGDQYVEAKLTCGSAHQFGVAARYSSANDHYLAWASNGGIYLYKRVAGTYAMIGSGIPSAFSSGDTLGIKVTGTNATTRISVYVNGVAKITDANPNIGTNAMLSTGCGACAGYASSTTTYQFDDFKVSAY